MATPPPSTQPQDAQQLPLPPQRVDLEGQTEQGLEVSDASKRAQWFAAAVLGANDGLLLMASLMMGVTAIRKDVRSMAITGVVGLFGGACSMGIGEFLSMNLQNDIKAAQMKREAKNPALGAEEMDPRKEKLLSPWQAVGVSALAFMVGALVPLLSTVFIREYKMRLTVVIVTVSVALMGLGWLSTELGKAPVVKTASRVLFGGWLDMGITFGLTKLIGTAASCLFTNSDRPRSCVMDHLI